MVYTVCHFKPSKAAFPALCLGNVAKHIVDAMITGAGSAGLWTIYFGAL